MNNDLIYASIGNYNMVDFLINHSAIIDNDALYYVVCGYYVDIAELLIKNGAIVKKNMLEYLHYYEISERFKLTDINYSKLIELLKKYLKI